MKKISRKDLQGLRRQFPVLSKDAMKNYVGGYNGGYTGGGTGDDWLDHGFYFKGPNGNYHWYRGYTRHSSKQVNYNNDSLYCEIDGYSNGKTYQTIDGPFGVSLEVVYFYRSARSGPLAGIAFNADTVGWICVLDDSLTHLISKTQADSVIKAWGIEN